MKIKTKKKAVKASEENGEKKKRTGRKWRFNLDIDSVDFPMLLLTLILIVFGVVMVFSASYYWSLGKTGNPYAFLIDEVMWVIIGLIAMYIVSRIDYGWFNNIWPIITLGSFVLLMLLFTPLGVNLNGATRWLNLGITIMPGEIAKLGAIFTVAGFLTGKTKDGKDREVSDFIRTICPMLALALAYGVLIMFQPNMSTAFTIAGAIMAMLLIAGMRWSHFFVLLGIAVAGGFGLIFIEGDYRLNRFTSFLDPFANASGTGFQVVQSLLALGSGGLWGRGLGDSVQKTLYLPEPQNDFILAIIGEELGFLGIMALIVVYILLIWRGLVIAFNAPDRFGFLIASGVSMLIGIQVFLNIAVVTSSMPPTGVALPFVSYGGNSMLVFCVGVGLILNISKQSANRKKRKEREEEIEREKQALNNYYYKNRR